MSKRLINFPILIFLFSGLGLSSQTVITNRVQPAVGDSLYFSIDSAVSGISYGNPGPNQDWDFRNLGMTGRRSEVYRPASVGNLAQQFPTADAVLIQGITEQYFKFYQDRIELLGTATLGGGPLPGIGGANVFPNPVVIQKFPESYLDELMYVTSNTVTLPSSILPDSILNTLPLRPDSFRIIFSQRFHKIADAWGELKLPVKNWNVLREKRTTTSQTNVEAKVAILGWIDVTALASSVFGNLFGNINTTTYAFISNETKGIVAQVNVDTLGNILGISYKPDDKTNTATNNRLQDLKISFYPNPVQNIIHIASETRFTDLEEYKIFDMAGRLISSSKLSVETATIDVATLFDGLYILRLYGANGKELGSEVFLKGKGL
ncbi:MAG: T9SS type A sorting domain-containing protein [Saprospiraceae bacterium]|nr:T9SS type A sorting domain-containing protein [Saprospiraceae bacterium]